MTTNTHEAEARERKVTRLAHECRLRGFTAEDIVRPEVRDELAATEKNGVSDLTFRLLLVRLDANAGKPRLQVVR